MEILFLPTYSETLPMQTLTALVRNVRRFFGGPADGQTMDIPTTARVGDTVNLYSAPLRRDSKPGEPWPGLIATPYKVGQRDCITEN